MKKKERMGFISLFIFLILSAFAIVCLESGLIIHAEGNENFSEIYGYDFTTRHIFQNAAWQSSPLYVQGSAKFGYMSTSEANDTVYNALNNLPLPTGLDYNKYPNFFIWKMDNTFATGITYVYLFEDNIRIASGYNSSGFGYIGGAEGQYCVLSYTYSNGAFTLTNSELDIDIPLTTGDRRVVAFTSSRDTGRFVASNIDEVYGANTNSGTSTYLALFDNCINPVTPSNIFFKMNYMLYDENGDFDYTNPITSGGVNADTIEQGLYLLKGSCIYLENTSFNNGTLHVNALLSDDQKNNSNLAVAIRANCTYSIKSDSSSRLTSKRLYYSGGTDDFTGMTSWIFGNYGASDTLTRDINCTLGTLGSYQLSLDNFSNGGKWSCSLSDINSNMLTSDIPSSTFFRSNIAGIASTFDGANSSNFVLDSASIDVGGISFNVGYLPQNKQNTDPYLTNVVYTFDLYVCDLSDENNIVWSDVIYSYTIDMLNGTSSVPTDGTVSYDDLNSAFDGNVPSQYLPSTDLSGGSGSSSSSSSGGNSLVNNDNDTINFNGNGEVARDIVNDLIPSDGVGGFTEQIENTLQANSWMQVVRTTFSFIPTSVFTQISLYIITVLGILAAAFVLRIILDLL